ncbi:hypothetical protein E4195_04435 [Pseudomonas putida]|jgi:hypothetical protein|uniref:hypothetical protein n=1 Tax=Pseudomonas putida TaxID=303 RepID=UPI0010751BEB|nr:hypothetical protein [Pseudomonas putida]ELS0925895.1 hypothetical protein [Pseudomonas putida]TFW38994.1 hypothetical protein E4195_04435 [Pseudomonas putida]
MLKIAPDPPLSTLCLEDIGPATVYALCAVHQAMLLQPKAPASIVMMTSMYEEETLRPLLWPHLLQLHMPT